MTIDSRVAFFGGHSVGPGIYPAQGYIFMRNPLGYANVEL